MARDEGGWRTTVVPGTLVAMVSALLIAVMAVRQPPRASGSVALTSGASGAVAELTGDETFIDLAYWEEFFLDGYSFTKQPTSECGQSDPDVLVCTYELSGNMRATHIGRASEFQSGTITTDLTETCTKPGGGTGNPEVRLGDGTITSQAGDQIHFRNQARSCSGLGTDGGYWIVTGGTGRFEEASGTMSAVVVLDNGILTVSAGTLKVRADLWDDILPPVPLPLIDPGAVGVEEGNEGQVTVDVPVTLSSPAAEPVTVDWATADTAEPGVATADVDYVAASGTLTFAAGETTQTVSITVNGDTEVEPPLLWGEWGLVEFSNPSPNATLDEDSALGATGVFVIIDDD